jgi:hypothetical protein
VLEKEKLMSLNRTNLFRTGLLAVVLLGATSMASAKSKARTPASTTAAPAGLIDVNTASQKELEAIKGIGSAYAKKIIDHRPYSSVDDLAKSGVPAKTLVEIKPLVTASAAPKPADPQTLPAESGAPARHSKRDAAPASAPASTPPSPGMVWVNTSTKVFHKQGDPWYGKTKHGKWMSEADAMQAGYRAAKSGAGTPEQP